ncbi:MAG: 2'-deoxycytidine 5'-triphosphate deaminase [Alphaproteobacteria bacterium]|nr:2'-deoxycytidine 5'-triphosphate deaminase [Alphaproteobacteria bacterium]
MAEAVRTFDILSKDAGTVSPEAVPPGTGIYPCQTIREMVKSGEIRATTGIMNDQIQPASIDLRLGNYAYPVTTSFLPGRGVKVLDKMKQLDDHFEDYKISLNNNNGNGALLEKGRVYVIPLMESIKLRSEVTAFANPKSSTGRLDILTRLIADEATKFDEVKDCYDGPLYVEVAPRSFSIVVKAGTRLNQLRFSRSRGEAAKQISSKEWEQLLRDEQIVRMRNSPPEQLPDLELDLIIGAKQSSNSCDDEKRTRFTENRAILPFHVDLKGSGKENDLIGWRSKENAGRIDLERRDYDPYDFWEPITFRKEPVLTLDPNRFYILITKEAIAVPPDYAAEMLPYDTRAGEFRVHYAGFFDPGFGWDPVTNMVGSSRGVLEVRSHEVPFLLEDGQLVGYLRYDRMAARPDQLYGHDSSSNYQGQGLKLAKQFSSILSAQSVSKD